jgi:hypothetical protein
MQNYALKLFCLNFKIQSNLVTTKLIENKILFLQTIVFFITSIKKPYNVLWNSIRVMSFEHLCEITKFEGSNIVMKLEI